MNSKTATLFTKVEIQKIIIFTIKFQKNEEKKTSCKCNCCDL